MRFTFILVLLVCCFTEVALSGDKILDSLKTASQKHPADLSLQLALAKAYSKGNTDTAKMLFNQLAHTSLQRNNLPVYIQAKISIGRIYADEGENVTAYNHYQQALNKAEKIDDKKLIAHIYKNMGALYISWKKFHEALSYYDKAEDMAAGVNETELVADCQNNKGTVYEQQKEYGKAITAYKNALDVYTQKNITAKISMALSNVAIVYKYQKNFPESLKYNLKALALSQKSGDDWMMAATLNNIGNVYAEMGDYKNAVAYCKKSIVLSQKINALEILESAYDSMGDIMAKAGDYKSAFEYQKRYVSVKDKFINIESTKQLSELSVKYETAKKQKLIQQQEFAIRSRNKTIMIIAAVFFTVLIIGYQFYRHYKLKQEAILQAEMIKQHEIATKGIIEAEERERKRIASDLHDGVGQLFSAVKLNMSSLMERVSLNTPEEKALADKTLAMVDESCREVRTIAHQMMPNILLKTGLSSAIKDFINKIDSQQLKVNVTTYGLSQRLESNTEIVLYRVVQECVNNVIKHAKASRLDINMAREKDNISVTIEDNGKGFNTGDKERFEGIGLKNIMNRIEYLKGTVDISSAINKGTLVAIYVPIN